MSIANLIIGKKPAPATKQESAPVQRPLTPEELIDAVAESEFGESVEHDTTGVGSQADGGSAPSAMKDGKSGDSDSPTKPTVVAKSKKTKGQVADTPKAPSGDPVGYGKS